MKESEKLGRFWDSLDKTILDEAGLYLNHGIEKSSSKVDTKRSLEDGERRFDQISLEERAKFDEETLLNVDNIKKHKKPSQSSKGFNNEYIVITILVAVEGEHKLPVINGSADLKQALHHLGSLPSKKTMAVEVLWTPQNEKDTLTERELLEKYPLLKPLYE